jgi:DNA-binding transcriptional regulator LsrR (DeoR family)
LNNLSPKDPANAAVDPLSKSDWREQPLRARVVYHYYLGGQTQQEIADLLGVTRLRVNRIVGQSRSDGLVRIEIQMPFANCVTLENKLRVHFALDDVCVIPTVPDPDLLQQTIGEAAGVMLEPLLRDGIRLGVGWGRTLRSAALRLTARRYADSCVTSLMGGLTRSSGTNTFEVSSEFARTIGAECYYVTAPIFCGSEDVRTTLLANASIADVMRRGREGDIALVSCGDLSDRSILASTEIVRENSASLRAAGAIGDILGTFLDDVGRPVNHPLNREVMALSLKDLKAYPVSILASGGLQKIQIMRAVLMGRYIRRLVTDEAVAEALLQ